MAAILATSRHLPPADAYDAWCSIVGASGGLDPARGVSGIADRLERAYDEAAETWWQLARDMNADSSAVLAHAPSAAGNVSDFGQMLAWERLVDGWVRADSRVLVVCDDPWMYRHLATRPGVARAGTRPGLICPVLRHFFRGFAVRGWVALRALVWAIATRRPRVPKRNAWLLVYAHPASKPDGEDAYFGGLMHEAPHLRRALHVDGGLRRGRALGGPRTVTLHAWGTVADALGLPFARWRPGRKARRGTRGWLVRRAAAIDGGSGQGAMIAWQLRCQRRWLADAEPTVVAWPWENHGWERALVRAARRTGTRTVGYQHATVAWREWNYSPRANADALESLPDQVFCAGPASRRRLVEWGVPAARLAVAGALRFAKPLAVQCDPAAPVFVALPFEFDVARQMVAALRPLAAGGARFVVRAHPMSPYAFDPSPGLVPADGPLSAQVSVSAVLYCLTSVGSEAALAGLPTLRFRPAHRVVADPMPPGISVPAASAADLGAALAALAPPAPIAFDDVFAPPDLDLWREALAPPLGAETELPPSPLRRRWLELHGDPVLRRWLRRRLVGQGEKAPPFVPHRPPYVADLFSAPPVARGPGARRAWKTALSAVPSAPFAFRLHGRDFKFAPGAAVDVFHARNLDLETFLGLHRFAWLAWTNVDPPWLTTLWQAWRRDFGTPSGDWPWHPYTAAERVANVLDAAERFGLPGPVGDTLDVLPAHGEAIAARLEYFGDRETGNHLANNGRGLYRVGLALGIERFADMGERILLREADRIFMPSGVLREGSSHYHALVAGWYRDCADAARRHGRPEAASLDEIAARAVGALRGLLLPGGLPLVGDVSPDCPPEVTLARLLAAPKTTPGAASLAADGWVRAGFGPWAGLWHVAPGGWSAYPGHGHQDVGAFELHHDRTRMFVDPGRGAYGETGDARLYGSAAVHNGLTVDGADPYPKNRPYYDDAFRRKVGGPPPRVAVEGDGVTIAFDGFARLLGVGAVERRWRFAGEHLTIEDAVAGRRRHRIERRLVTPMAARIDGDRVMLEGEGLSVSVRADAPPTLEPMTLWRGYGDGVPGTAIVFAADVELPWRGRIEIAAQRG